VTSFIVVTTDSELFRFFPADASLTPMGTFSCPARAGALPFSMAVDRNATAWVLFDDGELFRVTTADARCSSTTYLGGQHGMRVFGMAFAGDPARGGETLYVAQANGSDRLAFGSLDTTTLAIAILGYFKRDEWQGGELTGTGDGRLFGISFDIPGPGAHILEIDRNTAALKSRFAVPLGTYSSSSAFAYWRGDFFVFTALPKSPTLVHRVRPSDGTIALVNTLSAPIVGAGVSTCARE